MSAGRQSRRGATRGTPQRPPSRTSPSGPGVPRTLLVVLLVLLVPERSSVSPASPWSQAGRAVGVASRGVAALCSRVAGLSPRQRAMCRSAPDAMVAIGTGLRLGLLECQHQFRHERWNCTPPTGPAGPAGTGLALVLRVASREAAFSLAVQSAAISWSTAAACARGELSGCSCAKRQPTTTAATSPEPHAAAAFRWGGCSSDVEYGARLSRAFLDAAHSPATSTPPRLLMDSHNSKAGRKAVKMTLLTDCKCHGVSGSCSVRTCWTTLAPFRQVGDHLMARYRAAWPAVALPVTSPTASPTATLTAPRSRRHPVVGLRLAVREPRGARNSRAPGQPAGQHHVQAPRLPRRSDLVFLQGSPNYCEQDLASGSLGTAGRACNRTSRGADGCAVMCCGRGYNTRQVTSSQQCRCKFHWCCYVHCDVCTERYEEYTCK